MLFPECFMSFFSFLCVYMFLWCPALVAYSINKYEPLHAVSNDTYRYIYIYIYSAHCMLHACSRRLVQSYNKNGNITPYGKEKFYKGPAPSMTGPQWQIFFAQNIQSWTTKFGMITYHKGKFLKEFILSPTYGSGPGQKVTCPRSGARVQRY